MQLLTNPLISTIIMLVILIYSAILHEIAHGYVADRLGDPTARLLGRLTLNPIPHIDPIMSLALPLLLLLSGSTVVFGGAKPVPVDAFNLRDGERDMAIVALCGPLTNAALAIIAAALFHLLGRILPHAEIASIILYLLQMTTYINVLLAIFNLLPIPPLDGSKVFALLLPKDLAHAYLSLGNLGPFLLFFVLLSSGFQSFFRLLISRSLGFLGF